MATLSISTPGITLPDLLRRLLERKASPAPAPAVDIFGIEDVDDSGACEHRLSIDNNLALEGEARR